MKKEEDCVGGDGGPLIILQASAIAPWQGAADFDNSLMNGGSVETDYDVICQCEEEVAVVRRYDRDILVLWDSEWGGQIFALSAGEVIITQGCFGAGERPDFSSRTGLGQPHRSLSFHIQDTWLRLLVGADGGNEETWKYSDVPVMPGNWQCDVYSLDEYDVVIMRKA